MEFILPKVSTNWYLLYTNPRAEKKVAEAYQKMGFEYFLPLQKTLKQWSDRKKWVEEPLFKSYVFLKMNLEKSYYQALSVIGASKLVSFEGKPVVVDPREIDLVKRLLGNVESNICLESLLEDFSEIQGMEVDIMAGPLLGMHGKLIQRKGKQLVVVELRTMHQVLCVNIPMNHIRFPNNSRNNFKLNDIPQNAKC
jgi:transcription antitermination factor NusG